MKNLLVILGLLLVAFWSQPPAEAGEVYRKILNGVKTVCVKPIKLYGALVIIGASMLEQKIDLAIAEDLAKEALKKKADEKPAAETDEAVKVEGA
jgi:hypothetical protein